jgi:hypothetical protein
MPPRSDSGTEIWGGKHDDCAHEIKEGSEASEQADNTDHEAKCLRWFHAD